MIRDFDLIRRILLEVQAQPAGTRAFQLYLPGEYDQDTVTEHVMLLIDAGLLEGGELGGISGINIVNIQRLTWAGHDFIDAAKDETLWAKAKTTVLKPALAITFDALLQWLKAEAKTRLGIP
jgi:hypothetical protein